MAIKSNIPPVLVTQVINITTFKDIRDTLITLVENPVIKRVLMTEGTSEKGLAPFNMSHAQWRPENDVGIDAAMDSGIASVSGTCGAENSRTPKSLGKLMTKIDDLEFRMRKMTTAENRSQDPPYKPQVAPPWHRGGGSQNRGGFKNSGQDQPHRNAGSRGNFGQNGNDNRYQNSSRSSGFKSFRSDQNMSG